MQEDVESFADMFVDPPAECRKKALRARVDRERRAQMTDKQRKRGARRTQQINFRCSPAFRELAAGLAKHCECSIADVMEEALAKLADAKGYKRGQHERAGDRNAH